MEAKTDLKSRLPGRQLTVDPERAPHRSYHAATGFTNESTRHSFAGVAGGWNEAVPCNIALTHQAQTAKKGVAAAGETPQARKSPENAAAVRAASGGSINAALPPPDIAHECGIASNLFDVAEVFKRTPYIANLKPGGQYVAVDLFQADSVPSLMKTLLDDGFLHGECLTVAGCSMAENLHRVAWNPDRDIVHPACRSLMATNGAVGLRGNFTRDGAIVKTDGVETLKSTGPACCSGGEEAGFKAVRNRNYREGDVGGPSSPLRDGNLVSIDSERGSLDAQLSNAEFEERRAAWPAREQAFGSGYLWKYSRQVGAARHGAVTHRGGSVEKMCYADL